MSRFCFSREPWMSQLDSGAGPGAGDRAAGQGRGRVLPRPGPRAEEAVCLPAPFLLPTTTDPEYWKPSGTQGKTTQQSHFSASNMDHRACTDPTSWLPIRGKKWAFWPRGASRNSCCSDQCCLAFICLFIFHTVLFSLAAQRFEEACVISYRTSQIGNCLSWAEFLSVDAWPL